MKRLTIFVLIFIMLALSSCMNSHYHRGPALVDNEMWVCDEVNLWFYGSGYGEMEINDEVIPINVYVDDIDFFVFVEDPPVFGENDLIIVGDPVYPKSDLYLSFHKYDFDYFTVDLEKNFDHHRYKGILDDNAEITTLTFQKVIVDDGSTAE